MTGDRKVGKKMRRTGYKIFGGKLYKHYLHSTKKDVDEKAKQLKKMGYSIRRIKAKMSGWELYYYNK